MEESKEMRGESLYQALMALKPDALAETEWAKLAGLNHGWFTNLRQKGTSPRFDTLKKLLDVISRAPSDIYPGTVGAGDGPKVVPNAKPVVFEGAADVQIRHDLPVYGTALGAEVLVNGEAIEQTTLNRADVIEYRKRPPIINGIERVYGLYVQGSSMYPAHRDGSFVYVQRDAPLRVGDDVVVYLRPKDDTDDGERSDCVLIKRLVKRSGTYVELEQYSPALTFRIDMKDVVRIDRVLERNDYA